jgi:protein-arginine kinase
MILNFEDHLTIIVQINENALSHALQFAAQLLAKISASAFARHAHFGYLTTNPKYSGSGASLLYFVNEKMIPKNVEFAPQEALKKHT